MNTPITPPVPDPLVDPWERAPASWTPFPGPRAERARAGQFRKPLLWEFIVRPEDRALIAQLAGEILAADGATFAFGGTVLERLRALGTATDTAAERARFHALEVILSRELHALPDLLYRLRVLRGERP